MNGVCHIRPPPPPPPCHICPPITPDHINVNCFSFHMSKLVDSIVLNLLSAYIYNKNIPGPLVVHVFIKITHF